MESEKQLFMLVALGTGRNVPSLQYQALQLVGLWEVEEGEEMGA